MVCYYHLQLKGTRYSLLPAIYCCSIDRPEMYLILKELNLEHFDAERNKNASPNSYPGKNKTAPRNAGHVPYHTAIN